MLGLKRLRLAVMKEGVLSPVGGADGGFGHMVDDERQGRKFGDKVQLWEGSRGRLAPGQRGAGADRGRS